MDVFEIAGFATGVSRAGVNFLQPSDSFQNIQNGYVYRQVLQSRQGFNLFAKRLAGATRVMGIFEHTLPDATKELLAFDKNFLYKYNTGTGNFDLVPFAGSLIAYTGFNISSNEDYISGTSYPTKSNGARFVFTGRGISIAPGGSAIFYYDGTNVKDFTVDNADYAAPTQGPLTRATYVIWFGERLNFIIPTITAISYTQGVLYSGIRTLSGNGDKFNVAGSGLLQADTYENITGASILGQTISLNFDRSNWIIEKTRDAFNPYFIRKIPSVLGTNASFSAVSWADNVRSIGRTGIIATDGRQSLRVDDKIPYFTADEIDPLDFQLTYGGFDRVNNQFLWAYRESGSALEETQGKVLVNNYEERNWCVYDQRFSCFGQTDLGLNLAWDDIEYVAPDGNPSWAQWDTTEEIWDKIGVGLSVQKTLAGDNLGFIYQLNQDYDDYFVNITGITQASSAVLTVDDSAFQVGDLVVVESVEGMTQINNFDPSNDEASFSPYTVTAATTTSITLHADSTLFTSYSSGGTLSKIITFSAQTIPFNPYRDQGRKCFVSHVEFLIDTNGGSLKVDVYEDEEETPFKQNVLLKPTSIRKEREWITMTVDDEANFLTFVLNQQSPSVQVKLSSMRIHCRPGALTSG